ncbi:hypothetical protein THAOC_01085, partial [Thalassiosira oceanica]
MVLLFSIALMMAIALMATIAQAFSSAPSKNSDLMTLMTRPCRRKRARRRFALYSNQDNVGQEAKGMDEAFTSLDSLSSEDLRDEDDDGDEASMVDL